jgi:hypothetical protein
MLEHVVFELKFDLFTPDVEILLRMITEIERIVAMTTLAKTCISHKRW